MSSFVFVQPHLRFGGAERQTVLVANALVARGHSVHVVLHSGGGGLRGGLRPEVTVHVLGLESHLLTVEVARRLHGVLRRIPRSLVVVKLWSSILACALIDRRAGVAHHVYNYCEDLDPTDHAEFIRFGAVKQRLVGRVFRSRPHLSANTDTVAGSMEQVYGLARRPEVIPSTVDPVAIRSSLATSDVPEPDVFTVISVGSLIHRKGLDVTLAALERLGRRVHWRIVGEGPLAARFAAHHDPNGLLSITVEGGHAEPYGLMAASDVLVHSARSEAWGIVLLEALAVGTPVIAADSIGPAEMQRRLGDRPDLLELVPVGDVDALRERLAARATSTADRPSVDDCADHIRLVTIDHAVRLWEGRAARLLEAQA